jgi:hypothetical protein
VDRLEVGCVRREGKGGVEMSREHVQWLCVWGSLMSAVLSM